ncbi:sulfurtransferase [Mycobacterium kyorinense]|uniref:Sulfurtransferase n=1 Tax=Mycobacterium kyorinense TaxID=487514 RepID=A0A1A2YWV0_9MYCO|nr:MBL fold metallo-hydrolase [Mycobacterium kyorinense]OBI41717.1 sulfurtransferase [Mycobacterium kyorinense]
MIFRQYFLASLSQLSYLIGDSASGRAVVVDPHRDIAVYRHDAEEDGLCIERVIETHCHADFLSGHLELAAATGATICYGEGVTTDYPIESLHDGQRLHLGQVVLEIRATPGHTQESISIAVYEHRDHAIPYGVLTGDTLLIGDVGRPDLSSGVGCTSADMAHQLYQSLHHKLLTLPDETRVFPAHGPGSPCARNVSAETSSTIGQQRRTNQALALRDEAQFVTAVTTGQPPAPPYFSFAAQRNRERRPLLDEAAAPASLSITELAAQRSTGAVVLDARDPSEFAAGHLRGSVNVGLDGRFAEYAGSVLRPDQRLVLVCPEGKELEATIQLGRIGYDNVVGYLDNPLGAFVDHPEAIETSSRCTAEALATHRADNPGLVVLDVRNPGELSNGVIPGAVHIPLSQLVQRAHELDHTRPTTVYCAAGYRSMIAASWLTAAGFGDVSDLVGGYGAWAALPASEPVAAR